MTYAQALWDGIFRSNPVFRLMLGLVPVIGITYLAQNGIFLGLLTTGVLLAAVVGGLVFRPLVPEGARPILHLALLAIFTTLAHRLLVISYPDVVIRLGIYLPLIVVNGFVLHNVENLRKPGLAIASALGMGLGFTLALTLVGIVREFLAFGQFFGNSVMDVGLDLFALAATVPGGFIIVGLLLALVNALTGKGGEVSE